MCGVIHEAFGRNVNDFYRIEIKSNSTFEITSNRILVFKSWKYSGYKYRFCSRNSHFRIPVAGYNRRLVMVQSVMIANCTGLLRTLFRKRNGFIFKIASFNSIWTRRKRRKISTLDLRIIFLTTLLLGSDMIIFSSWMYSQMIDLISGGIQGIFIKLYKAKKPSFEGLWVVR